MKKKIAILTQPLGQNYGGIIQNFALQKVISNQGHLPITINRHKNKVYSFARVFLYDLKMVFFNMFKNDGKNYLTSKKRKELIKNNTKFIRNFLTLTTKIDSDDKLIQHFKKNKYDVIIVGSDQTWRPKYSPNIFNYYLDFLGENSNKSKCIAYASSFGTDDWEYTSEETQRVEILAKQFDAISVREESGINLCNTYLKVDAELVLDPTLLLNAEDYSQFLNLTENNTSKNKLYTYVLDNSEEKSGFLNKSSKLLDLELSNVWTETNVSENKFKNLITPPLENWLAGFKNAEFVITDSFHGTVFSILFKKPFISFVNKERGASRFESLLGKLGLENRLIYDIQNFDMSILNEPIHYEEVHQKLEILKENSIKFLKENI